MQLLMNELDRILEAIVILSPSSFSFAGVSLPVAQPAGASQWAAANPSQHPLPAALQGCLYQYCFCSRFQGGVPAQNAAVGPNDDMSAELSAANTSQARWEPGWQIYKVDASGQVFAQRGGIYRAFWPGQYVIQDGVGTGPRVGSSALVFFPKESFAAQPGFYFAFGEAETETPADDHLIRFYWNVRSEGAVELMRLATQSLNKFSAPFRMKSLTHRSQYVRLDPSIIYVNKRYFHIAAELLSEVHRRIEGWLGEETPLFTLRLASGLALAEDPGNGESFGMNRCRMLAEAVWSAYLQGDQSLAGRRAMVMSHFTSSGIDLERPHLNARSANRYDDAPFEAARA